MTLLFTNTANWGGQHQRLMDHPGALYGIGKHKEAVKTTFPYVRFWKTFYAYNQIYVLTGPVNKIAALLMYKRIFDTPFFRRAVFYMIIINVAWWLSMSLSSFFTCIPVYAY